MRWLILIGCMVLQSVNARAIGKSGPPVRIVALSPALAEMVVDLLGDSVAQERLVGVTEYSDTPSWISDRVRLGRLSEVGSYVQFSLEMVQAIKPDLVLATHDGNPPDRIRRLESLGVHVVISSINHLSEIGETYVALGRELGVVARGLEFQSEATRLIQEIKSHTPKSRARVFLQLGMDPLVTATRATFLGESMELLGADLLFGAEKERYPRISKEAVVGAHPQALWMMELSGDQQVEKRARAVWADFPAMAKLPVRMFEASAFSRPTLRLLRALRGEARHP